MSQTLQPQSQVLVVEEKKAVSLFSRSKKIDEKEKAEYVKALDDLCIALEKYSAVLTKKSSDMTAHSGRIDKLQITRENST